MITARNADSPRDRGIRVPGHYMIDRDQRRYPAMRRESRCEAGARPFDGIREAARQQISVLPYIGRAVEIARDDHRACACDPRESVHSRLGGGYTISPALEGPYR